MNPASELTPSDSRPTLPDMSVEVTRLDCVRGVSIRKAKKAVVDALAKRQFIPSTRKQGAREIYLSEERGWLVVYDSDMYASEPWAQRLSKALNATAVGIVAYADFGGLKVARFDSGKKLGELSIDEDTELERGGQLVVKLPFLEDLASATARPALREGFTVREPTDAMAVAIARKARLPKPRDAYRGPREGSVRLGFELKPNAKTTVTRGACRLRDLDVTQPIDMNQFGSPRALVESRPPTEEELALTEELAEVELLTSEELSRMADAWDVSEPSRIGPKPPRRSKRSRS